MIQHVQEHVPVRIPLDFVQYRFEAASDLGQEGEWNSLAGFCLFYELRLALQVRNGHIKRITDQDIQSLVLEIISSNVSTTFITCPADPKKTLGIKLPFLVMIIKNLKKYFTFEVQVSAGAMTSRGINAIEGK